MLLEHAISVLACALLFEHFWGSPASPWYPAHSFLSFASNIQSLLDKNNKIFGVLAWFLIVFASLSVFITLWYHLAYGNTQLSIALQALLLWTSLNWTSLIQQLRSKTDLSNQTHTTTTVTISLSQSFIAPLFYFILFGVLGAWFYRMTFLLSEHWRETGKKHESFSWFAAHISHIIDYLPLRLTTLFLHIRTIRVKDTPLHITTHEYIRTAHHTFIMMIIAMACLYFVFLP